MKQLYLKNVIEKEQNMMFFLGVLTGGLVIFVVMCCLFAGKDD